MNSVDPNRPSAWYLGTTPEVVSQWLARLRWATAGVDAFVVLAALLLPATAFPLRRLVPLIAAAALVNAEMAREPRLAGPSVRGVRAANLAVAAALLTGLLELSGGPSNAFSVVYVLLVALGLVTLGRGWAWLVAGWAAVCYGLLIFWHLEELVPAHHRLVDFPTHLFTLWLTIGVLAELAGHFVRDASSAVARREAQLDEMRRQAARTAHLVSLTTLAAGAAHELSTPLGTIAIASRELERALDGSLPPPGCAADARLIRQEVDRCQLILDQMSGRAGGSAAEPSAPAVVDAVLSDVLARLSPEHARRLHIHKPRELPGIVVPRAGLAQVILSLLRNALDATASPLPVHIEVAARGRWLQFVVRDEGDGMSPETLRRAGEPFYTTKEPGRGMGLGLFLARVFAERCGGTLTLKSERGTTVTLELPAAAVNAEVA